MSDSDWIKDVPREAWYAACASQRLGTAPVAARVLDTNIALWRGKDGAGHAVLDRCAHRGVQLSLGDITDGDIACRYHGWRYGGSGRCTHVPSLLDGHDIPRGIGVRAFPCTEAGGYVFVWTGEGAPGEPPALPDFAGYSWIQGVTHLGCTAIAAIENNLDWVHPVFAHPNTHPQYFVNQAKGFLEMAIETRRSPKGVISFSPPAADANAPVPEGEHVFNLTFELPDRSYVTFTAAEGPMRLVLHAVPTGPSSCRQEWMISLGAVKAGESQLVKWSDKLPKILEQDRDLMQSAEHNFLAEGHEFERSVEADMPTLLARRVYALAASGEWDAKRDTLTARRIMRVRA